MAERASSRCCMAALTSFLSWRMDLRSLRCSPPGRKCLWRWYPCAQRISVSRESSSTSPGIKLVGAGHNHQGPWAQCAVSIRALHHMHTNSHLLQFKFYCLLLLDANCQSWVHRPINQRTCSHLSRQLPWWGAVFGRVDITAMPKLPAVSKSCRALGPCFSKWCTPLQSLGS